MFFPLASLAIGATLLSSPFVAAIAPSEIPLDTPVSRLVQTAKTQLAAGNAQEALTYFDVAISRDPQNYLTIFNRGAAYLSLGKSTQARRDFDKVLQLKPGFEGALVQRARLRARSGEWVEAEKDFLAAGRSKGSPEVHELNEAHGSAVLAEAAAEAGNWEECVHQSGTAIVVAGAHAELRRLRARCRFERGEVAEGVSDLQHVLQISSGSTEPHVKVSVLQFYGLGETDQGLAQIRKCLQSDPDSKACRKLMKREKALDKSIKQVKQMVEKRTYVGATKLLIPSGEEPGLLQEVQNDLEEYVKEGLVHQNTPKGLYAALLDLTCEAYVEMNNHKRGQKYCEEVLKYDSASFWGLLAKAKTHMENDEFEDAIRALNEAKEAYGNSDRIQKLLNEAQTLLKRSKQKDYYKVLGVSRDADEREIKRAFRKLTLKFHPDKASSEGIPKDVAQKKMATINEAYEVLSDPELKARFDRGDDPNDPHQGQQPFQGSPHGGGQQFVFRQGGFPAGGSFQFGGFPGGGAFHGFG